MCSTQPQPVCTCSAGAAKVGGRGVANLTTRFCVSGSGRDGRRRVGAPTDAAPQWRQQVRHPHMPRSEQGAVVPDKRRATPPLEGRAGRLHGGVRAILEAASASRRQNTLSLVREVQPLQWTINGPFVSGGTGPAPIRSVTCQRSSLTHMFHTYCIASKYSISNVLRAHHRISTAVVYNSARPE